MKLRVEHSHKGEVNLNVNITVKSDIPLENSSEEKNEKEMLSNSKHEPFMTKSQFISLLASLATLATAVIAYFALRESILQRESIYRPELYIGETKYMADISDMNNIKYYQIVNDSVVKEKLVYTPLLKINNIGMGTALNVDGKTTFSWETSSPLLSKLKMPRKKGEQSYEDVFMHGSDSLKLPAGIGSMQWKNDYILPIGQTDNDHTEEFWSPNLGMIIKASVWLTKIQGSPVMPFMIPVKLTYRDINNKWYTRETEIMINCSVGSNNKDEYFITICSGQTHREFYNEMKKMMRPEEEEE